MHSRVWKALIYATDELSYALTSPSCRTLVSERGAHKLHKEPESRVTCVMDSGECECVLHRNGTLIFEMICKLFRSHCTTRPTQHFPFFNVIVCSTQPSIAQHSPRNSFDLNLHRDFSESLIPSLISLHESRAKMMLRRRRFVSLPIARLMTHSHR